MKKIIGIVLEQIVGLLCYGGTCLLVYLWWQTLFGSVLVPQTDYLPEVTFWECVIFAFFLGAYWTYRVLCPDIDVEKIKDSTPLELEAFIKKAGESAYLLPLYGIFYAMGRVKPAKIRLIEEELEFCGVLEELCNRMGKLPISFRTSIDKIDKLYDRLLCYDQAVRFNELFWRVIGLLEKELARDLNKMLHQKIAEKEYLKALEEFKKRQPIIFLIFSGPSRIWRFLGKNITKIENIVFS